MKTRFSSGMMQGRPPHRLLLLLPAVVYADLLQNPDFEAPPSNLRATATNPFVLLTKNTTIPGWSFDGTVQYVTAGPNISLPGNGHAVQLGQDGQINQTFRATGSLMDYVLTFTLAPGGENCSTSAIVNVSVQGRSSLFSLEQRYGKEMWESHAYYLGTWGDNHPVNLVLRSQPTEADPNITCGPVIDTILLKKNNQPTGVSGNLLLNGDFEIGPAFVSNSSEGVLLDSNPDTTSALQQWSVIGMVKYVDAKHYLVPQGNAAIQLVSGDLAGVEKTAILEKGNTYKLDFAMGANKSCAGDLVVGVNAGPAAQNFTLQTNGTTESIQRFSMAFKAESSVTPISFVGYSQGQTVDFGFCGPVIDDVVLLTSWGWRAVSQPRVLGLACLGFFAAVVVF